MSNRDKRALAILAVAAIVLMAMYFWPVETASAPAVGMYQTIPGAETRLGKLRKQATFLPSRDISEKKVASVLAEREKGLLKAETAAQAQALLLQIVRRTCDQQTPPIQIRGSSFGAPRPANEFYGEVNVTLGFTARIDQVVNVLSELAMQPELIAIDRVTIGQANEKQKDVPVQLVVTGLVPKSLVPEEKKGLLRF
jgi:hypothetical protein